ncbi:MAG TPA: alanine dehydrogenase [Stellaceae bacterium]|nr:alanine dehydrogenase [Stellaceae bacterium]
MLIGIPKEIKRHEYRVGLTPPAVREAVAHGHEVLVETGAGEAIGLHDAAYRAAGAAIAGNAQAVYERAAMIVKVKEPNPPEYALLRQGQVLFTYLHLAADPPQAEALARAAAIAIAYETVTDARGGLPLLAPMSEIAGRLSIQAGARALELIAGGRGVLLGGVPGVAPGKVAILGGGVVGSNAARMAVGLRAEVTLLDRALPRLRELDEEFGGRIRTLYATREAVEEAVIDADLVVGAVLVPGAAAPKLVSRALLKRMKRGAVLVDVAIDQGGCFETSHPTTHDAPTYVVDGITHYCVANMPGGVARSSTFALGNATLPFVLALADKGWRRALNEDPHLRAGLNLAHGRFTHPAVAAALGKEWVAPEEAMR